MSYGLAQVTSVSYGKVLGDSAADERSLSIALMVGTFNGIFKSFTVIFLEGATALLRLYFFE